MIYDAKTKDRVRTDFLAIHCAATRPSQDIGAKEIDRMHRQRGFTCIGYNFVIRRDGKIEVGRPQNQTGAHVQDWNSVSLGICLVGGVTEKDVNVAEDNFTPAQHLSLKGLLQGLQKEYPEARIQGHNEFLNVRKACPSFDVQKWLKANQITNP
jgi:N-acetylmuramoyl-L-alanine amidase